MDLYELLEAFTTCETMGPDDLWFCSVCKTLRQVWVRVRLGVDLYESIRRESVCGIRRGSVCGSVAREGWNDSKSVVN